MNYLDWTIALLANHSLKLSLVVLRPLMDGQLGDFDRRVVDFLDDTGDVVLVLCDLPHRASETTPPWEHRDLFLSIHQQPDVRDNVFGIIARDVRTPTSANTFGSVDKHHRKNGEVMLRFDQIIVILEIVEEGVIVGVEDCSCDGGGFREDVPGRGVVLTSLVSSSELTVWQQEIEVVTANVILGQVNNRHGQTLLSVVIGCVFRDVTDKLCHLQWCSVTGRELCSTQNRSHFDFLLEFPFETTPDNLPLTGLETIAYGRDRTNVVCNREKDEFFVDEIGERYLIRIVIEIGSRL